MASTFSDRLKLELQGSGENSGTWGDKTNNNLEIVGGAMGDKILDSDGVTEVSKLPTREEVLSSISALLVAPGGGLASSLTGPASVIAGVLENIGED